MNQASVLDEVSVAGGIITDHGPIDFHSLGLAGCIDRLTMPLRGEGTRINWETPHHGVEITAASASLLYHSAQELLSNALRHAHASNVTVRIELVYHGIRLTVIDTGNGFDPRAGGDRRHGFGLRLMLIAVREAEGTMTIDSAPGNGTSVTIMLPLD